VYLSIPKWKPHELARQFPGVLPYFLDFLDFDAEHCMPDQKIGSMPHKYTCDVCKITTPTTGGQNVFACLVCRNHWLTQNLSLSQIAQWRWGASNSLNPAWLWNSSYPISSALGRGADGARRDDTSKLKGLIAQWVNVEFKPDPSVDLDDKYTRGFINEACGRLLCPTELDWNSPV
jgi:hypothetical protein